MKAIENLTVITVLSDLIDIQHSSYSMRDANSPTPAHLLPPECHDETDQTHMVDA